MDGIAEARRARRVRERLLDAQMDERAGLEPELTAAIDRFLDLVERTTFAPGWSIEACRDLPSIELGEPYIGRVRVRITNRSADSDHPTIVTSTYMDVTLSPRFLVDLDRTRALFYVREMLQKAWQHEGDEWIKVDGVKVFDPHECDETKLARVRGQVLGEPTRAHDPEPVGYQGRV